MAKLKPENSKEMFIYYKKNGQMKYDCYKLQNKDKLVVADQKGQQPENSGEANIVDEDWNFLYDLHFPYIS